MTTVCATCGEALDWMGDCPNLSVQGRENEKAPRGNRGRISQAFHYGGTDDAILASESIQRSESQAVG